MDFRRRTSRHTDSGTLPREYLVLGEKQGTVQSVPREIWDLNKAIYNPWILELTQATANALVEANPDGHGIGIKEIFFEDDDYLEGKYLLYVQLHRGDGVASPRASLPADGVLRVGDKLISPNGRFTLWMQIDGNLVLYDGIPAVSTAYWATNTWGRPPGQVPNCANMQTDGHLVLY